MKNLFAPALIALVAVLGIPGMVAAQTDYYNTDKGRPLYTEDAYPVERRAIEIQAAPLRLERASGGTYHWGVEPEIAYGVLPRTQVEVGLPLLFIDAAGARASGIAGLELSVLHNLNVETALPAFGIAASASLPVGSLGPADPYFSFKGIATRTLSWARFHLNGEYTIGDEPSASGTAFEATRWTAGLAADHTFALRSLLIGGELVVEQPLESGARHVFVAGAGIRYQLSPRWAVDGGGGKRLSGESGSWYVTFGSAYSFGLPWP